MYSYVDVPLIAMMYASYELPDNVLDGTEQAGLFQPSEPPLRADAVLDTRMDMANEMNRAVSMRRLGIGLFMIFSFDIDGEFILVNHQSPFPHRIIREDIQNIQGYAVAVYGIDNIRKQFFPVDHATNIYQSC